MILTQAFEKIFDIVNKNIVYHPVWTTAIEIFDFKKAGIIFCQLYSFPSVLNVGWEL